MARSRGLGMGKLQPLSGNCFPFSNYSPLESPSSPLSSRPKRSEVERSLCGCSFLEMFFDKLFKGLYCTPA
jgi:hypothetical protein